MVLLLPFSNGIKTGDHRTLLNLLNKLFSIILDGQCSFFHWELLSYHPFCDFVAVTIRFYLFIFLGERYFNLFSYGCANVSTYVCRYVSIKLCLYWLHLTIDAMDILMINHFTYTKSILI